MNDKLVWLLERADQLRAEQRGAIDIPSLFTQLGIELRLVSSASGSGALNLTEHGHYIVTVKTYHPALLWSPRDRFSAAHELAHALLFEKWRFHPSPENRREYYRYEHLCNRFAGRLLVDPLLAANTCRGPATEVLDDLLALARMCEVSLEATARELLTHHEQLVFSRVELNINSAKCQLLWGVASLDSFRETRYRYFTCAEPLAAVLQWCGLSDVSQSDCRSAAEYGLSHTHRLVCIANRSTNKSLATKPSAVELNNLDSRPAEPFLEPLISA
jgi:hypothetical protein